MGTVTLLQALMSAVSPELTDIGLRITLVGMTTVYAGLVVLSFSLPLIRRMAEGKKNAAKSATLKPDTDDLTKEEVVAVTAAIHAHLTKINQIEDTKLTWELYERPYTPWRLAGRSRLLLDRTAFRQRNRSS